MDIKTNTQSIISLSHDKTKVLKVWIHQDDGEGGQKFTPKLLLRKQIFEKTLH